MTVLLHTAPTGIKTTNCQTRVVYGMQNNPCGCTSPTRSSIRYQYFEYISSRNMKDSELPNTCSTGCKATPTATCPWHHNPSVTHQHTHPTVTHPTHPPTQRRICVSLRTITAPTLIKPSSPSPSPPSACSTPPSAFLTHPFLSLPAQVWRLLL